MAVVIETTIGNLTVDLFTKERPIACLNFMKLCKLKYYNYNLFHTIEQGFIAQTGDPTGVGDGGTSIWGVVEGNHKRFFEGEMLPKIHHSSAGLLSLVGAGKNLLGSQFFFTLGDSLNSLDGQHCVIGEVVEGHEVLRQINESIVDDKFRPYQDIRITHTVILEDPFPDPRGFKAPSRSPSPSAERLKNGRIAADEDIDDTDGKTMEEVQEMLAEREAKARATILEIVGDLPDADMAPPENVLFVCKLNPVTTDDDLEIIFSRFGRVKSCEVIRDRKTEDSLQYAFIEFEEQKACEAAYFKMDNVLIDDRRIHVDFSQSVSKVQWRGKGRGVEGDSNDLDFNNLRGGGRYGSMKNERNQQRGNRYQRNSNERKHSRSRSRSRGRMTSTERRKAREERHREQEKQRRKSRSRSREGSGERRIARRDKERERAKRSSERRRNEKYSSPERRRDERYSSDRKRNERHSSERRGNERYSSDRKRDERYSSDRKRNERYSSDRKRNERHSSERRRYDSPQRRYSSDRKRNERHSSERRGNERYSSDRKRNERYSSERRRYDSPEKRRYDRNASQNLSNKRSKDDHYRSRRDRQESRSPARENDRKPRRRSSERRVEASPDSRNGHNKKLAKKRKLEKPKKKNKKSKKDSSSSEDDTSSESDSSESSTSSSSSSESSSEEERRRKKKTKKSKKHKKSKLKKSKSKK